jgi:hypothetical protein
LTGSWPTSYIQDQIDKATGTLVVKELTQDDGGIIVIPAGKKLELIDLTSAKAITLATDAILIVEDGKSLDGTGTIVTSNATLIGKQDVLARDSGTGPGTLVLLQDTLGADVVSANATLAVKGDITISDKATDTDTIISTRLPTNALYVIGNVTVDKAIIPAPSGDIVVIGNAAVETTAQTQVVNWHVSGTLTAKMAPTTGAGTITAGTLDVSEAGTSIALSGSGAITVDSLKTAGTVEINTGTGGLTINASVTGDAKFATAAKLGGGTFGGAVNFGGASTLTGITFNGNVTLGGALTIPEDEKITLGAGIAIKDASGDIVKAGSSPVVLTAGSSSAPVLTLTTGKLTITVNGLTITSGTLEVPATGTLEVGTGITLAIANGAKLTVGASTKQVSLENGSAIISSSAAVSLSGTAGTIPLGAASTITLTGHASTPGTLTLAGTGATVTSSAPNALFTLQGAGSFISGKAANTLGPITIGAGNILGTTTTATGSVLTLTGTAELLVQKNAAAGTFAIGAAGKGLILDVSGGGKITLEADSGYPGKITLACTNAAGQSGGIFTAISTDAANYTAVIAGGTTNGKLSDTDAASAAGVATEAPAAATANTIAGGASAPTVIDAKDTFNVTGGEVTVTPVS